MKLYKIIKKCRICKSPLKLLHKYRQTPLGEDFVKKNSKKKQPLLNLNLCICTNCNLVQISEIVDPKKIYKDYLYETKTSITLEKHFNDYSLKVCKKLNLNKQDLVIDIGSNDGNLLSHFKNISKCKVLGVEPAKHIAKISNRKGINTINSFFDKNIVNKINNKYGKARLVTANNVFANIENINAWIILIKQILAKEGFFIIESFYLADLLKNKVFDFIYHEHHSAFSLKPIIYLCNKHNLKLVHAERTSSKGGSLRYYLCRKSFNCKKIVYSSSAAVYGNQAIQPIKEDATLCPISVYAKTKVACEELIKDSNKKFGIDGISLRYFNPIGSHKRGIFKDELKNDNGSLMNEVLRVALDNNKILNIYISSHS